MSATLLIITHSLDTSIDFILDKYALDRESLFRLNSNLFPSYNLRFSNDAFEITDPLNRRIDSSTVKKVYYRKPSRVIDGSDPDDYVNSELWHGLKILTGLLWRMGKIVLVEPFCESVRLDKFVQADATRGLFAVPDAEFCYGRLRSTLEEAEVVVKSLSGHHVNGKGIYTTKVAKERLSPDYPWYVQEYAPARRDLTVVYVRGQIFAFCLDRSFLAATPDWRLHAARVGHGNLPWKPARMPADFEFRVREYMKRVRLDYGRLDFLWDGEAEYVFCEVNPNGQFAWLDLRDEVGMLSAIGHEIDPRTECHPIPYCPYIHREIEQANFPAQIWSAGARTAC